ncbi:hypothetical protein [Pandoraea bronchicola]|uniref:Uncharacterized protein n=1 Tax=Pandoraea bronchicola TaxID=2508287 RepID=A0A5E5BTV5_9BURK|nr:hypothetical protein [Pandoraea bronchicola]VVE88706.1 hypothetical protein PBR20603_02665 [Pandoraea bronchicola]
MSGYAATSRFVASAASNASGYRSAWNVSTPSLASLAASRLHGSQARHDDSTAIPTKPPYKRHRPSIGLTEYETAYSVNDSMLAI